LCFGISFSGVGSPPKAPSVSDSLLRSYVNGMPRPQRFCIFCDGPGLTRTHIWPDWLERLLSPGDQRLEELENPHVPSVRRAKIKQGSIFSQKPYLCCESCNTGWMRRFEDEMTAFAKPIFTSLESSIAVDKTHQRVLAVWLSLITILAEFIDHKTSICITEDDRKFLKKHLIPPHTWAIAVCSSDTKSWYGKYRHHASFVGQFTSLAEYYDAVAIGRPNNTQISTFGMGHLFAQVFSCPDLRIVSDYCAATRASGLVQLWPPPNSLWPFAKGLTQFPTKAVIKDDEAGVIADAFDKRMKFMTQPPHFGGWI
jgi:hypothetical protein